MRLLLGLVVVLLLLAGAAVLAFRSGLIGIGGRVEEVTLADVSPEAADAAERKLQRMNEGEPVRLTDVELTSLLRYRADVWATGAGAPPIVRMAADTVHVRGAIATAQLPNDPTLEAVRLLLPDTARIDLSGTIVPGDSGFVLFRIATLEVEGMPIPSRYVPIVLERVGYPQRDGLEPEIIEVQLPHGIGSADIQDGELLLTPNR